MLRVVYYQGVVVQLDPVVIVILVVVRVRHGAPSSPVW